MSRKYTTQHPHRGISTYARKGKGTYRDRYGKYREGVQLSPDVIHGKKWW